MATSVSMPMVSNMKFRCEIYRKTNSHTQTNGLHDPNVSVITGVSYFSIDEASFWEEQQLKWLYIGTILTIGSLPLWPHARRPLKQHEDEQMNPSSQFWQGQHWHNNKDPGAKTRIISCKRNWIFIICIKIKITELILFVLQPLFFV